VAKHIMKECDTEPWLIHNREGSAAYNRSLRRIVLLVALLNVAYFGVEFAVAGAVGSVSLFADSIDFFDDTSLNLLIFVGLS